MATSTARVLAGTAAAAALLLVADTAQAQNPQRAQASVSLTVVEPAGAYGTEPILVHSDSGLAEFSSRLQVEGASPYNAMVALPTAPEGVQVKVRDAGGRYRALEAGALLPIRAGYAGDEINYRISGATPARLPLTLDLVLLHS